MRDNGSMTTLKGEDTDIDLALEIYEPVALERCDAGQCGAAALVRVILADGNDLIFCRHDYFKREAFLASLGARAIFAEVPK